MPDSKRRDEPRLATLAALLPLGLLIVLAVARPPEIAPWSRCACQGLAALAIGLVACRSERGESLLPVWLTCLLPLALLSILFAACRARAIDEAADALALLFAGLAARGQARRPHASTILAALLLTLGSAAACRAVVQHHLLYPAAAAALRSSGSPGTDAALARLLDGRPSGPFILPAALGGFLALSLPLALAWALRPGRAIVRTAAAGAALVEAYALLLTRSLGALAALALGLLIALPLLAPRRKGRAIALGAAVLLATAALFLHQRRSEIEGAAGGHPLALRAGNWGVALRLGADHPLFGVGPGSFGTYYPRYRQEGMNETQHAHNLYLEAAACWGAWVLLPLGALLLLVARAVRRAAADPGERLAILAGGASFLAHNLVDFTAYLPGVAIPAAILLGLGLAGREGEAMSHGTAPRRWPLLRPALVLLLGTGLLWSGIIAARARSLYDAAREAATTGEIERAAALARLGARARPDDPLAQAFLSELILTHGLPDPGLRAEGERAARRALALDPEAAILHHDRALYHQAAGEPAAAYREEYLAHRLNPLKDLYRPLVEKPPEPAR
ncbi:MAG TPA: O-antigen ligase family protein [Candidatus Polarisedimenticolia bacterium]|nr:O-antigen ligase family protein [Candidatus Polarisedimenticolia bacterium]